MNDSCVATVSINVVVYRPNQDNKFDFITIDADSFASQLSSVDALNCSKEVKELLGKTKEVWPNIAHIETEKAD